MHRFSLFGALFLLAFAFPASPKSVSPGTVHTYYIAADEVDWNYTPLGVDKMMGMEFEGYSKVFTERGPHRIGSTYRKALYREYTDETFTTLKPRAPEWEHLGMLGPVLRAEVGDTIRVVFKNNATHPFTMHPHGVFYTKDSEGAGYDDGTNWRLECRRRVPYFCGHEWPVPEWLMPHMDWTD
jgi:FtsP/CotA-like multicopper oxidase with cupredoxin domain